MASSAIKRCLGNHADRQEISPSATFPGLIAQTAPLGGELLVRCLRDIIAGTVRGTISVPFFA